MNTSPNNCKCCQKIIQHRRDDAIYCKDCKKHMDNLYATWSTDENRSIEKRSKRWEVIKGIETKKLFIDDLKDYMKIEFEGLKGSISSIKSDVDSIKKKIDFDNFKPISF